MNKFEVYNKIYNFYRMFETWKLKNHEYYQYCCKKVKKHNHILHILTNGPSLNDTINYIDEVGGDVMMMNQMYLTPYYTKYRPKYMCFWDDDVYLNNEQLEEEVKNLNSNDDDMIIIFTEHMFKKYHTKYPKLNMKWIYTGGATRPYCKMKDKKNMRKIIRRRQPIQWRWLLYMQEYRWDMKKFIYMEMISHLYVTTVLMKIIKSI